MKIVLSGANGLLGGALIPSLKSGGHQVKRLVRQSGPAFGEEVAWDPAAGNIDRDGLEGQDAVIHFAAEPVAGRWNDEKKRRIRDSRVGGTAVIAEALSKVEAPPKVLLSASAIGYYGDRGQERLSEDAAVGQGFLAEVCRDWEAATEPAKRRGIRVVNMRIGIVLTPDGGALAQMLTPFKLGVGGKFGAGTQYMSWIALDDILGAVRHLLSADIEGPVNLTAPNPATNAEFTKAMGKVLSRPTFFKVPAFAARAMFGEMANELLLGGVAALPTKLLESSYVFGYPELEGALRHLLGR
jgi:uncharacterized protein (TIGR01777 family)